MANSGILEEMPPRSPPVGLFPSDWLLGADMAIVGYLILPLENVPRSACIVAASIDNCHDPMLWSLIRVSRGSPTVNECVLDPSMEYMEMSRLCASRA